MELYLFFGQENVFTYTNPKTQVPEVRHVIPYFMKWGTAPLVFTEPQWLILGQDTTTKGVEWFALNNIEVGG